MDPRRNPRTVIDPKVRQVGFFAPPDRSNSAPPEPLSSPQVSNISPSGNSLSPVMIPPPRHASGPVPISTVPTSSLRQDSLASGSFNASEHFPASSPTAPSSLTGRVYDGDGELQDDIIVSSPGRAGRGNLEKASGATAASSFPSGSFDMTAVKTSSVPASGLTTVSVVNMPPGIAEKAGGASSGTKNDRSASLKPLKEKTTKAERRALQEAQRAAKAASKAEGGKAPAASASVNVKPTRTTNPSSQKNDSVSVVASEKKTVDRMPEKDRKKDIPHPRLQYDDKSRVEKAKRHSVVKQIEARNRVELFRHLPQYEHGTQLPDLESKFFQLDSVHPAVYKVTRIASLRFLVARMLTFWTVGPVLKICNFLI